MKRIRSIVLTLGLASCASAPKPAPDVVMAPGSGIVGSGSGAAIAAAEVSARAFAPADVEFMQGMIPHHAQAVIMARWAIERTARNDIKTLARRINIAQTDEIRMMRRWLAERNQTVPDSTSTKHLMKMGDMVHEMLMPGMLTDEQMARLDKARGLEFDKLFLTSMIAHHRGAIEMVRELRSHGDAGHDDTVFRFASDVDTDQSAEIEIMISILESLPK